MKCLLASKHLRRSDPKLNHLPVIALTAHAFPEERRKCFEAGMNEFVNKPLDYEVLARALGRLLPDKISKTGRAQKTDSRVSGGGYLSAPAATPQAKENPLALPLVDVAVLNRLKEFQTADTDLVADLVRTFYDTSVEQMSAIAKAVEAGNCNELKEEAHALKSSTSNMGFKRMAALCQQLESLGSAEKFARDEAQRLFDQLRESFAQTKVELYKTYPPNQAKEAS
jgi:HPt (histidine-containing phosphotransfer) domain-containing protein